MNVPILAEILRSGFDGFRGSPEGLYADLASRKDFCSLSPDVPGNAHGLLCALKSIAPEMRALGVSLTIYDSGLIKVQAVRTLEIAQDEEASLRAAFNSPLPEAIAIRAEFGTFERFYAYKRGRSAGQINPPRRGKNVIDAEDKGTHAQVDPRLTIEAKCRARWELEPDTRSAFGNSYYRFEAYERAHAYGRVRKYAPGF